MKNVTEILLKSRERQLSLDALLQTITKHSFDGGVISAIKTLVTDAINDFRLIEAQAFTLVGNSSYSPSTYDPDVSYMVAVELPQLTSAYYIKAYYIDFLATVVDEMTAEEYSSEVPNNAYFQGDNFGATNDIIAKGATWTALHAGIIVGINDIIDALVADTADQS